MSQHNATKRTYTAAGTQLSPFARIGVAATVDVPSGEAHDQQERVSYRAPRQTTKRRRGMPLPWALLLILGTIAIMSTATVRKANAGKALQENFALIENKYFAAEQDCLDAREKLAAASDGSFICYYAAQNLGMTLAVHDETIQLSAPTMRAQQLTGSR